MRSPLAGPAPSAQAVRGEGPNCRTRYTSKRRPGFNAGALFDGVHAVDCSRMAGPVFDLVATADGITDQAGCKGAGGPATDIAPR